MNSIIKALNNIASSLNAIAVAITNSKKVQPVSLPEKPAITSNPISNVKITTASFNPKPQEMVSIPKEEKKAIDAIYDTVVVKGVNPEHHDQIMREIKDKWPVLFKALNNLVDVRRRHYNRTYSSYNFNKINHKHDKWY
jgi:hypothetical protein